MDSAKIILIGWIVLFILEFFIDWILDILNINSIIKNRKTIPAEFENYFENQIYQQSTAYSLKKAHFSLFQSVQARLIVLLVLILQLTGLLDLSIAQFSLSPYWHGLIFLAFSSFVLSLANMPASLYSKFVIEETFGFNKSGVKTLLADTVKSLIVGLILLMIILGGIYTLTYLTGEYWWIAAWGFITAFQFIITILYPMIIAPLFNKFEPLPDGELKTRLESLAVRCKFTVKNILVMDGSRRSGHSNAYFTGLGRFRRIVIFDTLIEALQPDELEAVLAHEIGHWKFGHIRSHLIINTVVTLGLFALAGQALQWPALFHAFGFNGISLHAFFFIVSFFSSPLSSLFIPLLNSRLRKHEYQADRFAVQQMGSADPMQRALLTLTKDNLSNLTPHQAYSFWHYSHPSLSERLKGLKSAG